MCCCAGSPGASVTVIYPLEHIASARGAVGSRVTPAEQATTRRWDRCRPEPHGRRARSSSLPPRRLQDSPRRSTIARASACVCPTTLPEWGLYMCPDSGPCGNQWSSVRLPHDTNLSRRCSPQAGGKATTAKREPMRGKQHEADGVLCHPGRERRIGTAAEDPERGSPGRSSKNLARLAQLRLGRLSNRMVVGTRSAPSAASQGTSLRCERHNRQPAARFGQFSCLTQCRPATADGFKDDQHARGRTSIPPTVDRASRGRGHEHAHGQRS
jgi:hypothetical protein